MVHLDDLPLTLRKVLITGSREWDNEEKLRVALLDLWTPGAVLVSGGCAQGADRIAETLWDAWGGMVLRYPADWHAPCTARCHHQTRGSFSYSWCPMAGLYRNEMMVDHGADVCLACYKEGAKNRGTSYCASYAARQGIPVIKIRG